jgi:hypothetical protein
MPTVNQVFQSAPTGRRFMLSMAVSLAVIAIVLAAQVIVFLEIRSRHPEPVSELMWMIAAPVGSLLFVGIKLYHDRSQVVRFKIEDSVLVIGKKRYPLAGAVDINLDPDILRRAFKIPGNGGTGAFRGRYWSRRVGKFDAYLTGEDHAVVVRWPDRVVAVSPEDTEFFILAARAAAGIR